MLRWNSLILVFFIGAGCCANVFAQREVSNFPQNLKDAIVPGSTESQEAVAKRPWLFGDDAFVKAKKTSKPKPDSATVAAPSAKSGMNFSDQVASEDQTSAPTLTPEVRQEIEDKIRAELEQKFQSKIEGMVKKQLSEQNKTQNSTFKGPTLNGEIVPLVPAKGYLLTDYTLTPKNRSQIANSGKTANFNDSNRRPVTRTISDGRVPEAIKFDAETDNIESSKTEQPSSQPTINEPKEVIETPQVPQTAATVETPTQPILETPVATTLPLPQAPAPPSQSAATSQTAMATQPTQPSPSATLLPPASSVAVAPELPKEVAQQVSILENSGTASTLRSSVIGPEYLGVGNAETFEIVIENRSGEIAKDVVVQMSVPDAITISRLDREAYLDRNNRTISWRVAKIDAKTKEVIRYRATSKTSGRHDQEIKLGMNSRLQGVTPFTTVVTNSPVQQIDLPSSDPLPVEVAERPVLEK